MTFSSSTDFDTVAEAVARGRRQPLYLVVGDRVLAEPAALRLGEELATQVGCPLEVHRRPAALGSLLADLKTYSLFAPAKVLVAVETAVLADAEAAVDLVDEALEACPVSAETAAELTEVERRSACRLLQTLRLFQIDPKTGPAAQLIEQLPKWALKGGKRAGRRRSRGARQVEEVATQLAGLLEAARTAGLHGWAESDLDELADIVDRGLPEGHALVLAESVAGPRHPLVQAVMARGCLIDAGAVKAAKGGRWQGLDRLVQELRRETGRGIAPAAVEELARRTIQRRQSRRGGAGEVSPESTARFAAEYRKLATLAGTADIELELVENAVEDRGEEDAWKTLDAIGSGRADEALQRVRRLLGAAEDPIAARLSFFSLLAGFARQLTLLADLIDTLDLPRGAMSYPSFKNRVAPRLQADLPDGRRSPVAGLHPYRLYRAYAVACSIPPGRLRSLPARVLRTELQLKGESGRPDVALSALICDLATALRPAR